MHIYPGPPRSAGRRPPLDDAALAGRSGYCNSLIGSLLGSLISSGYCHSNNYTYCTYILVVL